jgi:hypothetical protein
MDYAELAERWSGFAAPAGIYRVDPDVEPLDDLFGLADRAGLDAAADRGFTEVGPLLEIERGAQVFTVYRPSRAVQWTDTERWQVDDGGASWDISDDDAVAAAVDQVDRLELAGADVFAPRRVTRLRVSTAERGGVPDDVRVVDVGVVLARVLDGLPVEGPGGNIVVYLDRERQLTGFERVARRIAGVHEPVRAWRPVDDVIAETEAYWGRRLDRGLSVRDVRVGYVELGRLATQEFIQPAYVLSLTLDNADDAASRTIEHYVAAATNNTGDLMPSDSGPASGRRR